MNLYVTEPGAVVSCEDEAVIVSKNGERLMKTECCRLDTVLLYGGTHITAPALKRLARNDIGIAFLDEHGGIIARVAAPYSKNVPLRLSQYAMAGNAEASLAFARGIIRDKIRSEQRLIASYQANNPSPVLADVLTVLKRASADAAHAENRDTLLGIEGSAAKAYFSALRLLFGEHLEFNGRSIRPPKDGANALMSFGYALLAREIGGMLEGMGLDPGIGMLHTPLYGRNSLVCDMLEPFRADIADRLAVRIASKGLLSAGDFEQRDGGVFLGKDIIRKYIGWYERTITRVRKYVRRHRTPREAMRLACERVRRTIMEYSGTDHHAEAVCSSS